jgi:zinc protease
MKKHLVALSALLLAGSTWSQQKKIDFIEYDLPNGLHVILHEDHSVPVTAVTVMYHVGSKNERSDRTGFAHFFEHLLFEGSQNIKRGDYAQIVEKRGGALNANTSQDRTFYYELLPSNELELGLWLESERLLHAKVEKQGIETQRSVVKEEKRQRVDNKPYGANLANLCARVFKNHPYKWVPIGSMEHLDAAQEEDYVNFYKTFYVPANAVLSIAGDINIAQTKEMINKYFGSIPAGQGINLYRDFLNLNDQDFKTKYGIEKSTFDQSNYFNSKNPEAVKLMQKYAAMKTVIPTPNPVDVPLTKQEVDTIYDNIQLPALFIGYRCPSQTDKDFPAFEILNDILCSGASSRMNKNIVEKKQLAVDAFAYGLPLEHQGLAMVAGIGVDGVNLDTLLTALDEEIAIAQKTLVTAEELQKVLNQYENNAASSNTSVAKIAEDLADNYMYRKNTNLINQQLDAYLKVTREDIMRVAKKYYTKDARVVLYYLPKAQ